jgi:integrase
MQPTFYRIGREIVDTLEKSAATRRQYDLLLRRLAPIHDVLVGDLDTPALWRAVKAIQADGALQVARRAVRFAGLVMRYARAEGMRTAPDCSGELAGLLRSKVAVPRSAITDEPGLKMALAALQKAQGSPALVAAVQILPHVFVRPSELVAATWAEIDMDERLWVIPKERMKMRRDHVVPLSEPVVVLLRGLELEDAHFVFPGKESGTHLSRAALNVCMKRCGLPASTCVPHGWRSTASTFLNEWGVDRDLVEIQLAHQRRGVAGIYNRAERLAERRALMDRWSSYLTGLLPPDECLEPVL